MIDDNQRYETFLNAPENIRQLYSSHESTLFLNNLFKEAEYLEQAKELINDTILGFYKISDMPRLFQQKLEVSADVSQRMTSQLIEFLAPVVKREEEASKLQAESKATLMQTFATPTTPTVPTEETSGAPVSQIAPLRTMQSDITRIHGYGAYVQQEQEKSAEDTTISSSQEDLLSKN